MPFFGSSSFYFVNRISFLLTFGRGTFLFKDKKGEDLIRSTSRSVARVRGECVP